MNISLYYKKAYYILDQSGNPRIWYADVVHDKQYSVMYGVVNGTIQTNIINCENSAQEVSQAINVKRRQGYKKLSELKDDEDLPVEGNLVSYLVTYLPKIRTTVDGTKLPMLAKTFDNKDNKLFNKSELYYGQFKINGLRCSLSYRSIKDGLFTTNKFVFQSREGIVWNSLDDLAARLMRDIPHRLLDMMITLGISLDGELYVTNSTVNQINSFVKTPDTIGNKRLQFWCYDIICDELTQKERFDELYKYESHIPSIYHNLNNVHDVARWHNTSFIILPIVTVESEKQAVRHRDLFISSGFEGIILRNPDSTYQFGKRNKAMIKFKKHTDGIFDILDIVPEGVKRPDVAKFICKNDINNEVFEVRLSAPIEIQKKIYAERDKHIGRKLYVEYGERSGVTKVPFHVKIVRFYSDRR